MKNYCLYYLPKSNDPLNDVLTIYFGDNKMVTNRTEQNGIGILLNNLDVIGFLIPDFSKYCKVKIVGTIFLPNDKLIDVINSILANANFPTLDYYTNSGYVIGEIKEVIINNKSYIYKIDIGEEIYSESSYELAIHNKIVVAKNGTYILPARKIGEYKIKDGYISGGRICSFEDLQINAPKLDMPVMVDEDLEVGKDFFSMEVIAHA